MSNLTFLFGAAVVLAGLLASISIWSRRRVALKVTALVVSALFLPLAHTSLVDLLSRPKPVALERNGADFAEATVLSAVLREDEAIYVWLELEGLDEPRAYVLPWDEKRARELHEAQRQAKGDGAEVKVRRPFDEDAEPEKPLFYAAPQPALPAKRDPAPSPLVFERSRG